MATVDRVKTTTEDTQLHQQTLFWCFSCLNSSASTKDHPKADGAGNRQVGSVNGAEILAR
ncbi:MAG: hypothetical protein A2508_07410 [Candidatus Lambdaproteobacteria bacterium RIFOXYD12_FULL_49_8]|uniref:Uncharacterized protein n=1 Tax=Candidatus Lambdaproteobacteria bacterium RIFOXYD2_FULL_50_16 TaxID=1817772 RepID=A0A1F6G960_9PROT|nr:MAG: hypothetical protein A2527_05510 [Candidatus Lambdaproteobacteria bacterium RIFOXYD2_FULL_50_16]OGG97413.1 MAG: hypothetical protein A2508_07410 [Candidatus Lambdaproteobacteria bacterium RIFOXYD12_FULL_49_8]